LEQSIKAVLWDVGGTLAVLKSPSAFDSIARTLARCNIDPQLVPAERIVQTQAAYLANERSWRTLYDEHRDREVWAAGLLEGCGLQDRVRKELSVELRNYYDIYEPVAGIFDLLAELRERGLRQAIVSNWPPSLPLFLKYHGLHDYFDAIVFSAEDGVHKPDPRIFHRALRRLDARPYEAILIGDDPYWDIEGAYRIGMRAIHFDPRRQHPTRHADDVATLRQLLFEMI
jgi:HAD superfamily hydrolase (TIGR01509 family)